MVLVKNGILLNTRSWAPYFFSPAIVKNKVRRLCGGSFFLSPKSSEGRSSNGLLSHFLPEYSSSNDGRRRKQAGRQSHWPLKMAPTYRYVSMPLTSFDVIRDLLDRKVDSSHTSDFLTSKIIITETILTWKVKIPPQALWSNVHYLAHTCRLFP